MEIHDIGVIGLGVMGQNLALNIERHGYSVAGYDLEERKIAEFKIKSEGKKLRAYGSLQDFLNSLQTPKKILMMVPAGKPVDAVIRDVRPHLSSGDLLVDGGNTYFEDTDRRVRELEGTGIFYVGTGVSGGEEGALLGPSIMPGGNPEAWPLVKPILQAISAKAHDGAPCCDWIGSGGAGHFVKMVHNGIEYGDMQMIGEAYFLMEQLLGLTPDEMHAVFAEWNQGELNSYLIEITSEIMKKKDDETGQPMVYVILDTAGQKGTGRWTSQKALDLGVPAQTIAEAVFARTISALKQERVAASEILKGPRPQLKDNRTEFIEMIRQALYASKICSYAQGFQIMRAADREYQWKLNFGTIASLWRAGCIIRAQFLDKVKEAFDRVPDLANLLLAPYFKSAIEKSQDAWRKVIVAAVESGVPVPAFSSALAYYDSYRAHVLPANLLQAQRDYFGAHTYQRIDKEGVFHTNWKE